ncbi:MAG: hypothetical protein ACREXR_23270, partial [Gammaproteobacteria bacterium]
SNIEICWHMRDRFAIFISFDSENPSSVDKNSADRHSVHGLYGIQAQGRITVPATATGFRFPSRNDAWETHLVPNLSYIIELTD